MEEEKIEETVSAAEEEKKENIDTTVEDDGAVDNFAPEEPQEVPAE